MKLAPHSHSGRRLARQHTSFAALAMVMLVAGVLLLGYGTAARSSTDLSVTAAIAVPLPTGAPRITSPVDGARVSNAVVTVVGTCDPGLVVKLLVADRQTAAGLCAVTGKFSVKVTLAPGLSAISARQYNSDGVASARSNVVNVTCAPGPGTGQAAPVALIVTAPETVEGGSPKAAIKFRLRIVQGTRPFAVRWVWGDGFDYLQTWDQAGDITGDHSYDKPGSYQVEAQFTDAAGSTAVLDIVAVVAGPAAAPVQIIDGGLLLIAWPIYGLLGLLLLSFWLGEHFERLRHPERQPARLRLPASRARRRSEKLVAWLGAVVLLSLGGWQLAGQAGQPVHTGAVLPPEPSASPVFQRFQGRWLAYDIPAGLIYRPARGDITLPESDIFTQSQIQLAVTLRHVTLENDSPLALRRARPDLYRQEQLSGGVVLVTGPQEVAAFVPRLGEVVEVVASGADPAQLRPIVLGAVNHLEIAP